MNSAVSITLLKTFNIEMNNKQLKFLGFNVVFLNVCYVYNYYAFSTALSLRFFVCYLNNSNTEIYKLITAQAYFITQFRSIFLKF